MTVKDNGDTLGSSVRPSLVLWSATGAARHFRRDIAFARVAVPPRLRRSVRNAVVTTTGVSTASQPSGAPATRTCSSSLRGCASYADTATGSAAAAAALRAPSGGASRPPGNTPRSPSPTPPFSTPECLKDLQRFLAHDDPDTREAFFHLAAWRTAERDLVPLLVHYADDADVAYQALRLATLMSLPPEPGLPRDAAARQASAAAVVRRAVVEADGALGTLVGLAAGPLSRHPRMTERDAQTLQLVLTFLRNLLALPDKARGAGSRDALVQRLGEEAALDVVAAAAGHAHEAPFKQDAALLLEVVAGLLGGTPPAAVVRAGLDAEKEGAALAKGGGAEERPEGLSAEAAAAPIATPTSLEAPALAPPTRAQPSESETGPSSRKPAQRDGSSPLTSVDRPGRGFFGAAVGAAGAGAAPPPPDARRHPRFHRGGLVRQLPNGSRPVFPDAAEPGRIGGKRATVKAGVVGVGRVFAVGGGSAVGSSRDLAVRTSANAAARVGAESRHVPDPLASIALRKGGPGKGSLVAAPDVGPSEMGAVAAAPLSDAGHVALWSFADSMLEGGYDCLMDVLRREVEKGIGVSRLDRDDLLRWLAVARWFVEAACRRAEADSASGDKARAGAGLRRVAATLGWDTFSAVQQLWTRQLDTPVSSPDKDVRLQAASLGLLKELMFALDAAVRLGTDDDRDAADRLQRRLLFDDQRESGLLPLLGKAIRTHAPAAGGTRADAHNLCEAAHVVLKTLDRLDGAEEGGFVVAQRRRKERKTERAERAKKAVAQAAAEARAAAGGGEVGDAAAAEAAARAQAAADLEDEDAERRDGATAEIVLDLRRRVASELALPSVVAFFVQVMAGWRDAPAFSLHCAVAFLRRVSLPKAEGGMGLGAMVWNLPCLLTLDDVLNAPELGGKADPAMRRGHIRRYAELLRFAQGTTARLLARLAPRTADALATAADTSSLLSPAGAVSPAPTRGAPPNEENHVDRQAQQRAERESQIRANVRSLAFVEVLFQCTRGDAEDIACDYGWQDAEERRLHGGLRTRRKSHKRTRLLGDEDTGEWAREVANDVRRRRGGWTVDEEDVVRRLHVDVAGRRDATARLVAALGERHTSAAVARKLKDLGLWDESAQGTSAGARAARAARELLGGKGVKGGASAGAAAAASARRCLAEAADLWAGRPVGSVGLADHEVVPDDVTSSQALGTGAARRLLKGLGFSAPARRGAAAAAAAAALVATNDDVDCAAAKSDGRYWRWPAEGGAGKAGVALQLLDRALKEGRRLLEAEPLERTRKRRRGPAYDRDFVDADPEDSDEEPESLSEGNASRDDSDDDESLDEKTPSDGEGGGLAAGRSRRRVVAAAGEKVAPDADADDDGGVQDALAQLRARRARLGELAGETAAAPDGATQVVAGPTKYAVDLPQATAGDVDVAPPPSPGQVARLAVEAEVEAEMAVPALSG